MRRRALRRLRRRNAIALRKHDDRQICAVFAQGRDQLRSPVLVPACQQCGLNLAAVRTLEHGERAFLVGRAHDAPAGARGDRRDQPALVRIGVEQQKGAGWFFAHVRLGAAAYAKGVKAVLRRRAERGAWGVASRLVMDTADRVERGIFMAEEESLLVSPPTQDVAVHVRDYTRFTRMLKWGAMTVFVIAFIVLLILKNSPPHRMKIAVLKEAPGETRCAAIPETVKKFIALGAEVAVEKGAGENASIADADFEAAGAKVGSRADVLKGAGIILCINGPDAASAQGAEKGVLLVGALDPSRRREADRRLRIGRTRRAGYGVDAAHNPRPVDGHPLIAVEPRRVQSGDRCGGGLRPRLPDDDDRGRDDQPGEGLRNGRRSGRPPGDRHRQAARRAGQCDRRAIRDQRADPCRSAPSRSSSRMSPASKARALADTRRKCRRNIRRPRPSWCPATSPSRTSSSPPR